MTNDDATLREIEFKAATHAAGFCLMLGASLIEITGRDRASFLHNLCTADIKSLAPGDGCELFFTDVRGKTIGYGWVVANTDSLIIATAPGEAPTLLSHLDRYLIREDVQLVDRSAEWQQAVLCGNQAEAMMGEQWKIRLGSQYFSHAQVVIQDVKLHCCRIPFYGVPGFTLRVESRETDDLTTILRSCGTQCDASILEFLRIRSGSPRFGVDITEANFPQEIDRDQQAISFTKGCYLGQETVARIDALGQVQQLLRKLEIHGADSIPPPGTVIETEEKPVGQITSASRSPEDGRMLALGFVRRAQASAGTRLHSVCGDVEVL